MSTPKICSNERIHLVIILQYLHLSLTIRHCIDIFIVHYLIHKYCIFDHKKYKLHSFLFLLQYFTFMKRRNSTKTINTIDMPWDRFLHFSLCRFEYGWLLKIMNFISLVAFSIENVRRWISHDFLSILSCCWSWYRNTVKYLFCQVFCKLFWCMDLLYLMPDVSCPLIWPITWSLLPDLL